MQASYYNRRYKYFRTRYQIQSNFGFNGTDIRIYGNGKIFPGKNSYIGSYSTIQLHDECKVVIGEHCRISHNVRFYTSSADPNQDFTLPRSKPDVKGDIIIGNGVWVGANVFTDPDIKIGDNAVVGANAVLTKDVPPKAIVGGVPARIVHYKDL